MVTLNVNGQPRQVHAPSDMPVLWVLRYVEVAHTESRGLAIAR